MSISRIRRPAVYATALAAVTLSGTLLAGSLVPAGATTGISSLRPAPAKTGTASLKAACPKAPPGFERCFALYRPQIAVNKAIEAGVAGRQSKPHGLTAKEIEAAYRLPVNRNSHQTVAVSIAFHTPHLPTYLAMYRHEMGLPPCTVKSGCLRQVNQKGKALPHERNGTFTGWDLEAVLDVSMISVACPHCKIIVVEAREPSVGDLARTDDVAARLGASVISNSYGGREDGFAMAFAKSYDHPGHTTVVSSGDFGYSAANFPASLKTVTAAGGTILARAHNKRGWWERAWLNFNEFGAGSSGCSAYVGKPSWQHDKNCPGRTVADISAVADNIPIFDKTYGGWVTVGGTSISAPLISGIYGLAGNASKIPLGYAYSHRQFLFDVTRGSNALFVPSKDACGNDYLCVARKGYDAPTGLGTPNGIKAF
ncbi:MAG TPA: S8 family serine peptidase [Streptosporangiaceae bacterium]|nr:S8 family serine peptidase [Streptosporangiaceae bacterium]